MNVFSHLGNKPSNHTAWQSLTLPMKLENSAWRWLTFLGCRSAHMVYTAYCELSRKRECIVLMETKHNFNVSQHTL